MKGLGNQGATETHEAVRTMLAKRWTASQIEAALAALWGVRPLEKCPAGCRPGNARAKMCASCGDRCFVESATDARSSDLPDLREEAVALVNEHRELYFAELRSLLEARHPELSADQVSEAMSRIRYLRDDARVRYAHRGFLTALDVD
jgi:hypothetical protein